MVEERVSKIEQESFVDKARRADVVTAEKTTHRMEALLFRRVIELYCIHDDGLVFTRVGLALTESSEFHAGQSAIMAQHQSI